LHPLTCDSLKTLELITDSRSEPLQLRLAVEGKLIGFYREDSGQKLLIPDELASALQQETQARQLAEEQAEQERQRAEQERQQRELAQQQMAQMEAILARYREQFGELPD
jgi:vacuolar-type H+-ATPase subunit I/STV1